MTDPAQARPSSSNPSTNPLFQNTEIEQFARFLTSSLTEAFRQSNDQPRRRVQHLRASDLPQYEGDSLDGGDAEAFLTKLDTTFKLANTPEEDQIHYASQAFPERSTAHAWFEKQKAQDTCTDDLTDELKYSLFCEAFRIRFATPLARGYQLEDLWDRFTQKGSVREHYNKINRLVTQLRHLGIEYQSDVVASKYLRSLKPELSHLLSVKNTDGAVPELSTVHTLAIESEYQLSKNSKSQLYALFPPFDTKDCKRIASLKAAGKWKEKEKEKDKTEPNAQS
jgi:hypothetical protein